jgi:Protein of unknown function (DUF3224)
MAAKPVEARFTTQSWDENTWDGQKSADVKTAKLTRADIKYTYTGALQGTSQLQFLMSYVGDGTFGSFVGVEYFTGTLDGKNGTFTLIHNGTFDAVGVKTAVSVVPNSGTGDLVGLSGAGRIDLVGQQESYPIHLEYTL